MDSVSFRIIKQVARRCEKLGESAAKIEVIVGLAIDGSDAGEAAPEGERVTLEDSDASLVFVKDNGEHHFKTEL